MGYTKEQRIVNQMHGSTKQERQQPRYEDRSSVSDGMFLPNYSGVKHALDSQQGQTISETIELFPEFAGAIIVEGSSTLANLGFGFENSSNVAHSYYDWEYSGANLSDIEIKVLFKIPRLFKQFQSNAIQIFFNSDTTDNTEQKIDFYIYKDGDTGTSASDTANVSSSAGTWDSHIFTNSNLTSVSLSSGDVIQIRAVLHSKLGNAIKLGKIKVNYLW